MLKLDENIIDWLGLCDRKTAPNGWKFRSSRCSIGNCWKKYPKYSQKSHAGGGTTVQTIVTVQHFWSCTYALGAKDKIKNELPVQKNFERASGLRENVCHFCWKWRPCNGLNLNMLMFPHYQFTCSGSVNQQGQCSGAASRLNSVWSWVSPGMLPYMFCVTS